MAESASASAGSDGLTVCPLVDKTLKDIAAKQGFKKPKFHIESGSGFGEGFMSDLLRVVIRDEGETESSPVANIIYKLSSVEGTFHREVFEREGTMYTSTLPTIAALAGLKEPLPWPKCHHAAAGEKPPYSLVLDDLRPQGFSLVRRGEPLDAAHCRIALRQLARLHGAGMAVRHLRPDVFESLKTALGNPYDSAALWEVFDSFLIAMQKAPDLITDRFPEGSPVSTVLRKLYAMFGNTSGFAHIHGQHLDPAGFTFTHGDAHSNNYMFKYDEAGSVVDCRIIDLQLSMVGCPTSDLAMLLLSSTERSTRAEHWDDMLREYHQELQATLRTAGCQDPDAVYSWDLFQSQMRRTSLYGLCMAPMAISAFTADEDSVREMRDTIAKTSESGGGSEQETVTLQRTPVVIRRFTGVVEDIIRWGWLPSVEELDSMWVARA